MPSTSSIKPSQDSESTSSRHTTSSRLSRSERAAICLQTSSSDRQQGRSGVTSSILDPTTSGLSSKQPLRSSRKERAATCVLPDMVFSTGYSGAISVLKPMTKPRQYERAATPSTNYMSTVTSGSSRAELCVAPAVAACCAERATTRLTHSNTAPTEKVPPQGYTRSNTASTSEAPLEQVSSATSTSTAAPCAVRTTTRSIRSNTASTAASTSEVPPPVSSTEDYRSRRIARNERTAARRAHRVGSNTTSSSRSFAFAKTADVSSEGAPLVSALNSETQSEQPGNLVRKELTDPFVSRPSQAAPLTLIGKCHAATRQYGFQLGALAAAESPRYTVPADETPTTEPLSFKGIELESISEEIVGSPSRGLTESQDQRSYREMKDRREADMAKIEQEDEDSQFSFINRCHSRKAHKKERKARIETLLEQQEESLLRAHDLEVEKEKIAAEERHARYMEVEKARKAAEEIRLRFWEEERKKKAAQDARAPLPPKAKFLIITRNKGKPDEQVSKIAVKSWRPSPETPIHSASKAPVDSVPVAPIRSAPVAPVRSDLLPPKPKLTIHRGPDPVVPCLVRPNPSYTLSVTNMSVSSSVIQKKQDHLEGMLHAALECGPIKNKPVTRYGRFAHETPIYSGSPAFPLKTSKTSTLCACEDTIHSTSCLKHTGAPKKQKSVRFEQQTETFEYDAAPWYYKDVLYIPHEGDDAERPVQWKTDSEELAVLDDPYDTMWKIELKSTQDDDWGIVWESKKPYVQFRHDSQRHLVEQVREFYGLQVVEEMVFPGKFVEVKQTFTDFYGLRSGGKWSGVMMDASPYPLQDEFHPRSFGKILFKHREAGFLSEPYQVNGGRVGIHGRYQCEKGGNCVKFLYGCQCGCDKAWVQYFGKPGGMMKAYRVRNKTVAVNNA